MIYTSARALVQSTECAAFGEAVLEIELESRFDRPGPSPCPSERRV
jgi:hypothetical protein